MKSLKERSLRRSRILHHYGSDIIKSEGMQQEKGFTQHADISTYRHSIAVAAMSIMLVEALRLKVDMRSTVRGALLHDYFLYDWHEPDESHKRHGFIHANRALKNAERDFELDDIQRDIISKHMFPLNPKLPKYRESVVVTVADKICATREVLHNIKKGKR